MSIKLSFFTIKLKKMAFVMKIVFKTISGIPQF